MGKRISMATRRELLDTVREGYAGKSRSEKSRILDEFVGVTGYHRKHALVLVQRKQDFRVWCITYSASLKL